MINIDKPIFVAGHNGMVGSAIVRALKKNNYTNIITADRQELDLSIQKDVDVFKNNEIGLVYNAAAKSRGYNRK